MVGEHGDRAGPMSTEVFGEFLCRGCRGCHSDDVMAGCLGGVGVGPIA